MKKKYLIFGATGSIGSSLANQLYQEKKDCHLIGRNEEELKEIMAGMRCQRAPISEANIETEQIKKFQRSHCEHKNCCGCQSKGNAGLQRSDFRNVNPISKFLHLPHPCMPSKYRPKLFSHCSLSLFSNHCCYTSDPPARVCTLQGSWS